jgi:TonB family protein
MEEESSMRRFMRTYPFLFLFILGLHGALLFLTLEISQDAKTERDSALVVRILDLRSKRQIVESLDSENRERREDAFLSDKTRSFDRQTKARVVDSFNPRPSAGGTRRGKKNLKLSELGANLGDPFAHAAKEYSKKMRGQLEQGGNHRWVSSSNDYVKDIPLGDLTYLNTVEYKYYGFYHRIKQKLEQFWGRSLHEKAGLLAKEGRHLAYSDEHITGLRITLDPRGEIIGVEIQNSSGVKELDDAAVESFNQAGPFPNPPRDLIVDGKVTLEWGFVVKS